MARRPMSARSLCLVRDRVRYVGDPVAFVVADTLNQAKDAAELIEVTYDTLPAVITAEAALAPGAPALHDDNPGNECFFHEAGDKAAVDAAFAKATHLVRHKIVINRITANTMEPRGCLANTTPWTAAIRSAARCSRRMARAPCWPDRSSSCRKTSSA